MKSHNAVRSTKPAKTFKPLFRMLPVGRAYVEKAWPTMRSLDWTRALDTAKVLPMGFSIPRASLSASTVVLLIACGVPQSEERHDISADVPVAQGGERLEAWGYLLGEASVFRAFRDTKLGVECSFAPTESAPGPERLYRCAPETGVDVIYLDAKCSQPMFWRGYGTTPPGGLVSAQLTSGKATWSAVPGTPPAPRQAFRFGERTVEHGAYDEVFARDEDGSCRPGASEPGHVNAGIGDLIPVDASQFVSAKGRRLALADGGEVERLLAEDGAQMNLGVINDDGAFCEVQTFGRCVTPPVLGPVHSSADPDANSDCSNPAAVRAYFEGPPPTATLYGVAPDSQKVYALGPTDRVWAGCAESDRSESGAGYYYYRLEEDVTAGLPQLQRSVSVAGAIRIVGREAGTGRTIHVAEMASNCPTARDREGRLACFAGQAEYLTETKY